MKHGVLLVVFVLILAGYIAWAVHEVLSGPMKALFA